MKQRVVSIDMLRGAVMVLMAIDHVRVYAGIPAGGPDPAIFFTRWITHFCAPGFAFLAGTGIFFLKKKWNDANRLSRFLVSRGLLLVVMELTLIRFFWTFNLDLKNFMLAGVIWMLGWCMVLMALLSRLKPRTALIIGVLIAGGQQVFHFLPDIVGLGPVFNFIYPTAAKGPDSIAVLYVIVPWIGVMAAGYGFGLVIAMSPERRKKFCLWIGGSCILGFIIAGGIQSLSNNDAENPHSFLLRLLDQRKYPASPLYLLMTLGPLIFAIPLLEKAKGWFANMLLVLGRVPMFYYILHILLIHLSALLVNWIRTGNIHQDWYHIAPYWTVQPEGTRWSLPVLYLVFIADVTILFFICRWYARVKSENPAAWMKYI